MKVYSSARHQRKPSILNHTVQTNLTNLAELLKNHNVPVFSQSPSIQSFDGEEEALTLAR